MLFRSLSPDDDKPEAFFGTYETRLLLTPNCTPITALNQAEDDALAELIAAVSANQLPHISTSQRYPGGLKIFPALLRPVFAAGR